MPLTLTIGNVDRLDNGVPARLVLDRHGAVIGRSPQADWSLPDPQHYISSIHCEIDFRDGAYVLTDRSTNGTFINGADTRPDGPQPIRDGDHILIGAYEVSARLDPEADAAAARAQEAAGIAPRGRSMGLAGASDWGGWDTHGASPVAAPSSADDWLAPAAAPAISGTGAMSAHWAPDRSVSPAPLAPAPAPPPSGGWAPPPEPRPASASSWSSAIPTEPAPPGAADIWGKLADTNVVDWARGGFGEPAAPVLAPAPRRDPLGLDEPAPPSPSGAWAPSPPSASAAGAGWGVPAESSGAAAAWGAPVADPVRPSPPQRPAFEPAVSPAATRGAGGEWAAFVEAAGLNTSDLRAEPRAVLSAAGALLKRLTAGMVVMIEARARAKAQLGAQGTMLELEGNNPLKFARTPEKALAQLLNPPERGFMAAERAVEDGFRDLQAHQMATLVAMQGALAATLARFSPQSIRERAEMRGLLARIIPSARDATLWKAYEKEFEGVARGSDEAFMDVFAKEFKSAYEAAASDLKGRR